MTSLDPSRKALGVPASPSGHSAEPEPCSTVSAAVAASVPNAVGAAIATIRDEIKRLEDENARLSEYLSTLYMNALRSTPKTMAQFVSFIAHSLVDFVSSGRHVGEAITAFEAAQKCEECGAFSPVLGNGLCFDCAPEGQWPCFASVDRSGAAAKTAQTGLAEGESAVPANSGETPTPKSKSQGQVP